MYPMVCYQPDLSFTTVKLSQYSPCLAKIHFNNVQHLLKHLHQMRHEEQPKLDSKPLPTVLSTEHDLLKQKQQCHKPLTAIGTSNADWVSCTRTQRSFSGSLIKLAGAAEAYKTKLQDTLATLSTESEFMATYNLAKMLLYVRSITRDLNVPQEVVSKLYKDYDACTAMASTQKPRTHTGHMDIHYNLLCEWVERDLVILKRVDTTINEADHLTKIFARVLFHQHINYIMGHVLPEYSPAQL